MDYYHALMADRTLALVRQELNAQGVLQTVSGNAQANVLCHAPQCRGRGDRSGESR